MQQIGICSGNTAQVFTSIKSRKGEILDEFMQVTGLHRKAAIRLLHRTNQARIGKRRGRLRIYGSDVTGMPLKPHLNVWVQQLIREIMMLARLITIMTSLYFHISPTCSIPGIPLMYHEAV